MVCPRSFYSVCQTTASLPQPSRFQRRSDPVNPVFATLSRLGMESTSCSSKPAPGADALQGRPGSAFYNRTYRIIPRSRDRGNCGSWQGARVWCSHSHMREPQQGLGPKSPGPQGVAPQIHACCGALLARTSSTVLRSAFASSGTHKCRGRQEKLQALIRA